MTDSKNETTSVVTDDAEARFRSEAMARVESWLDWWNGPEIAITKDQEFARMVGVIRDSVYLGHMFGGGLDVEVDSILARVRSALAAEGGG